MIILIMTILMEIIIIIISYDDINDDNIGNGNY